MPLNLQLSNVSIPGSNTRRANAPAGEGAMQLGESLSQVAKTLHQMKSSIGEDPIAGMNLFTQYANETRQAQKALRENPDLDFNTYPDEAFRIQQQIDKKYGDLARESGTTKFFAQRATPFSIGIQDEVGKHATTLGEQYSQTMVSVAEDTAIQTLTESQSADEKDAAIDGRVPTTMVTEPGGLSESGELVQGGTVRLNLSNTLNVRAALLNYYNDLVEAKKYNPSLDINKKMLEMGKKLKKMTLLGVARQYADILSLSASEILDEETKKVKVNFKGFIPAYDPITRQFVDIPLQINYEDMQEMIQEAQKELGNIVKARADIRNEEKAVAKINDDKIQAKIMLIYGNAKTTNTEREAIIRHLQTRNTWVTPEGEKFEWADEKNKVDFLSSLNNYNRAGGPAKLNNNIIIAPIIDKLAQGLQVDYDDILTLKANSNEATFNQAFALYQNQLGKNLTRVQEAYTESKDELNSLVGHIPDVTNDVDAKFVADILTNRFRMLWLATPPEEKTIEKLAELKERVITSNLNAIVRQGEVYDKPGYIETLAIDVHGEPFWTEDEILREWSMNRERFQPGTTLNSTITEWRLREAALEYADKGKEGKLGLEAFREKRNKRLEEIKAARKKEKERIADSVKRPAGSPKLSITELDEIQSRQEKINETTRRFNQKLLEKQIQRQGHEVAK